MEIDAIAFDAFGTLFDPGDMLDAFQSRVIPWMWHLSAAQRFVRLPELVELAIGEDAAERLTRLPAFDDVAPGLDALGDRRLAILSNGTREGLEQLVASAALEGHFEHLLAADQVERYKPAPEIYALASEAFGVAAGRILLVSGNEWDVAGASFAGLRTAWVARGKRPQWVLGTEADVVVDDLRGLA
jgi:2-haloalkanoic acid dehalogenase type II